MQFRIWIYKISVASRKNVLRAKTTFLFSFLFFGGFNGIDTSENKMKIINGKEKIWVLDSIVLYIDRRNRWAVRCLFNGNIERSMVECEWVHRIYVEINENEIKNKLMLQWIWLLLYARLIVHLLLSCELPR